MQKDNVYSLIEKNSVESTHNKEEGKGNESSTVTFLPPSLSLFC